MKLSGRVKERGEVEESEKDEGDEWGDETLRKGRERLREKIVKKEKGEKREVKTE